jgi:hypothetical protein
MLFAVADFLFRQTQSVMDCATVERRGYSYSYLQLARPHGNCNCTSDFRYPLALVRYGSFSSTRVPALFIVTQHRAVMTTTTMREKNEKKALACRSEAFTC